MPSRFDPQKHHRRSIRLKGYDYSQPGAYFVTVVAYQRECLFGEIVNGEMRLNEYGEVVKWEWESLPQRFRYLELGAFVVMPNHFHGIIAFHDIVGATRQNFNKTISGKTSLQTISTDSIDGSPLPNGPQPASLGAIIGQFKSRVTKRLWKIPALKGTPIWQRNYYEHIIRNEQEMAKIWDYIETNPLHWADDDENPMNIQP